MPIDCGALGREGGIICWGRFILIVPM
jgi:hypothetical protein